MSLPSDWNYKRLEDVVSKNKYAMVDGPFGSNLKSEHYKPEGIPVLQSGFVTSGIFKADKYVYVEYQLFEAQKRSSAKGGDILMAKIGAQAGRCAIIPHDHVDSIIAGNCLKLSFDDNDTRFFNYVLAFDYEKSGLSEIKTETAQPAISLKSLKAYKVPVPPIEEQKKIAQILTTWDQGIATTERLLDLARQQKKALMQQLLTGKKRFPEFEGEWKTGVLGDVANIDSGFAFKSDDFSDDENAVPIIRMSDFKSGALDLSSSAKVMADVLFGLDRFALKSNDFVFGMSGSLSNYAWVKKSNLPCYLNQRVGRIVAKDNADQMFVTYLYLSDRIQQSILDKAAGAAQLNISVTDLRTMSIKYPCLQEQRQIAQVLTTSNQEIETLQSQLDGLKQEKKALMQALLTGKRRVQL